MVEKPLVLLSSTDVFAGQLKLFEKEELKEKQKKKIVKRK